MGFLFFLGVWIFWTAMMGFLFFLGVWIFCEFFIPKFLNYTSFLLLGLLCGLGGSARNILCGGGFDDTDSNSLPHVSDGETSGRGEFGEGFHAHGLGRDQLDDSSITRLDGFGVGFSSLSGTTIDLLLDLVEFASNMSSVAIQDWRVSVADLSGVVKDNDLGGEVLGSAGGLVLRVGSDVSSLDVLNGDILNVESDVVAGNGLGQRFVVHLDCLDLSGQLVRSEGDDHAGFHDSSLNTTNGNCSNSSNFVNILKGQTEGLVCGASGGNDGIEGFQERCSLTGSLLGGDLPALVPGHVGGGFNHVVAVPSGNGHESNSGGIVSDLLDETLNFLDDFLETSTRVGWLGGVHLVDADNQLFDTQGVGQEGVLTGLTVLGDTGLEFSHTGSDNQYTTISLGSTSNHVLDEISVAGGVNDGHVELGSLELPEGDIHGDTTFTFGLQFVQNPSVLEGAFAHLLGFLLELFDGTFVDATALVDQVTSGGRLARVDVANDHNVDMGLFLRHSGFFRFSH